MAFNHNFKRFLQIFIIIFALQVGNVQLIGQSQIGNTILHSAETVEITDNGKKLIAGFPSDDTNGTDAGKITTYELQGTTWTEIGTPIYGNAGDKIGQHIDMVPDGSILSYFTENNDVRIVQNSSGSWTQLGQTIAAGIPGPFESIALSRDGKRVAFSNMDNSTGLAKVYEWDGTNWNQMGSNILSVGQEAGSDAFGYNLDISADGTTLAVAAPYSLINHGEITIFKWDGSNWNSNGMILGVFNGEGMGAALKITPDGKTVAFSTPGDYGPLSNSSGSLKVYKQSTFGSAWVQQGSDIIGVANYGSGHGGYVDISDNGNRLVWEGPEFGPYIFNGIVQAYQFDGSSWNVIFEKTGTANYEGYGSRGVSFDQSANIISVHSYGTTKVYGIGSVSGRLYNDYTQNCTPSTFPTGVPNHLAMIQPGNIVVQTDSLGFWSVGYLSAGNYTFTIDTSGLWTTNCPLTYNFTIVNGALPTTLTDIGLYAKANKTDAKVSITMPTIRTCSNQNIWVTVCNSNGSTTVIDSAEVIIQIDTALTVNGMSIPFSSLGNNRYLVPQDPILPGDCSLFTIDVDVSCFALFNQSICIETKLTPDNYCYEEPTPNPLLPTSSLVGLCQTAYDGSHLEVTGYCQNDSIYFEITNTAPAGNDMDCYQPIVVLKDGVWMHVDSVQLNAQQTYTLAFEGGGESWHLMTNQHPLFPITSHPNATVENCGGITLPSMLASYAQDDFSSCKDIFCDVVTGPYDPNDKRGYPLGFTADNFVFPNGQMQYIVRFQNVGNDTAINVVVRDTIDTDLDIFSLRMGASSHNFNYTISGRILEVAFPNILLPDSLTNNAGSNGFFSFTINQNKDLAPGTYLHNSAAIYFDYNPPIITNETERVVYYLLEGRDEVSACGSFTWIDGITYTSSNNTATYTYQNIFGLDSIVHLDLTIYTSVNSLDVITACNSYTWIDGNTYTSSNNTATYTYPGGAQNGCDSIVILDLTIETVNIGVTVNGNTLTADVSGASYQWLDCDNNNAIIPGETNQSFTPSINGNYAVEITENNCTEISACYSIVMTRIVENQAFEGLRIYPNPTSSRINIDLGQSMQEVHLQVMNSLGQLIHEQFEASSDFLNIELEGANGIYLIKLRSASGSSEWIKVNKIN